MTFRAICACIAALASIGFVAPAAAAPFDDALAAFDKGDYATAIQLFRPLAEQGRASVQYNLGVMYAHGLGAKQDYAEAAKWYRLAADQGDAEGRVDLGGLYYNGQGVAQDYAEAARWFRLAAGQGSPLAQFDLGGLSESGLSVPQDLAAAANWYRQAADQGYGLAQLNLGMFYLAGEGGLPNDRVRAFMWTSLAAAAGEPDAPHWRDIIAKTMTPDELDAAQKLIADWKPARH